ncbi:MAG: magnesium transporter CorA family protein [bacterium]|nr:magnesium transporter CorA family protein [bacterium]
MHTILKGPSVTWIDIQDPQKEDIEYLQKEFNFHPLVLDQIIPPSWSTKVEVFPDHLLLILFFPSYNKEKRESRPRELDIIATKDILVTSHYNSIVPLKEVLHQCNLHKEEQAKWMAQGTGYLLHHLLHALWEDCSAKVNRIDQKLTRIEESMFQGKEREMLKEISIIKADIINFWKIVRPQKGIFTSLRDISGEFFGPQLTPYFSHMRNHWARVASSLLANKETIEALEDTNNALLSHKTNEIMKVLTMFSVVLLPLTLIAGIFSMNTKLLPITGMPNDFWILFGIMVTCALLTIGYFKKKKWL